MQENSETQTRNGNIFYGWLDDPCQTEPSYEPPRDAPCPFCGFAIHAGDVSTHSLKFRGQYAARSYFYRTHRTCADGDTTGTAMDSFIWNMIARNGD
jgi:hypothetical protein